MSRRKVVEKFSFVPKVAVVERFNCIHFDGETMLLKRNSNQDYGSPSSTLKVWSLKPPRTKCGKKKKNPLYKMRGEKGAFLKMFIIIQCMEIGT